MYDDIAKGLLITEEEIERRNRNIYNNSLMVAETPLTDADGKKLWRVINPYDFVSGSLRTMDSDHSMGHQGFMDYSSVIIEIPGGETYYTYAITPSEGYVHMKRRGLTLSSANGASQPARIRTTLFNDATATGGTEIPVKNTNDNLPSYTQLQNFNLLGVSPSNLGNDLQRGNITTVEVGAQSRSVENIENIMKQNSTYVLRIENLVSNVSARVQLDWLFYQINL